MITISKTLHNGLFIEVKKDGNAQMAMYKVTFSNPGGVVAGDMRNVYMTLAEFQEASAFIANANVALQSMK